MRHCELLAVILLAGVVRLAVFLAWTPELSGDALDYDRLARSLLEGRGYVNAMGEPTSWRPPLYPAFVAAGYAFTGGSVHAVRLLQVLLDLGTIALVYAVGRSLFGRGQGLIAAILITVNVGTVAATSRLLSETLFTLLLMIGVVVSVPWVNAIGENRSKRAIMLGMAAGALCGAATLARGIMFVYPFYLVSCIALITWGRFSSRATSVPACWRAASLGSLALVLGFVLTLTPWTVRNYRVQGAFVPVATQGGMTLYASYNPPKGWIFGTLPRDEVTAAAERLSEPEANVELTRAALNSISVHPLSLFKLEALKILYFWVPLDWEILPIYGAFNPTYSFIALWAFLYVGFHSRHAFFDTAPIWLPIVYAFGMALVFYGSPRLRLPVEPLLALFAAAQLVALDQRLGRRASLAVIVVSVSVLVVVATSAGAIKHYAKQRMFFPGSSTHLPRTISSAAEIDGMVVKAQARDKVQPRSLVIGQYSGGANRMGRAPCGGYRT